MVSWHSQPRPLGPLEEILMCATRKSDCTATARTMHQTSRVKQRREALKRILPSAITATLLTVFVGLVLPGKAGAGCSNPGILAQSGIQQVLWQTELGSPSLLPVSNSDGDQKIVGLWKV